MTPKQKATELARALGVVLESGGEGGRFEIAAYAPPGKVFASSPGVSILVESIWDRQKPADLWRSMATRLADGLIVGEPQP